MNNRSRVRWIVLAALLLLTFASRLCHLDIVWVEEAYPAAAAIQMSDYGKTIYQDFWFDKPPGAAYFYRLFDAQPGLPLRIAGTFFVFACALLAYAAARKAWGEREGLFAAALLVFSLTFDHPSAVMAIAPDLLMVLPHLAALCLLAYRQHIPAGIATGVAFWINPKAAFLGAAGLLWSRSPAFAISAALTGAVLLAPVWQGWWDQVIVWGRAYSADPPGVAPLWEGVRQTGSWIWFHLTLVACAAIALTRENRRWTFVAMLALNLCAVILGLRFYPRYFFQLLPLMVILAARGFWLIPVRYRCLLLGLLLIPAIRFGRQYPILAADLIAGRPHQWNQLALADDSREAADILARNRDAANDTLFVWGYRPDILMRTRMPLGAPYLDSQPLNGVLADRHLQSAKPSVKPVGDPHAIRATFVVDGLGLLNPALAFPAGGAYNEIARTRYSILYRRRIQ
jgi:hypothetical protein